MPNRIGTYHHSNIAKDFNNKEMSIGKKKNF